MSVIKKKGGEAPLNPSLDNIHSLESNILALESSIHSLKIHSSRRLGFREWMLDSRGKMFDSRNWMLSRDGLRGPSAPFF